VKLVYEVQFSLWRSREIILGNSKLLPKVLDEHIFSKSVQTTAYKHGERQHVAALPQDQVAFPQNERLGMGSLLSSDGQ
jgi:hypothetical protein